MSDGRPTVFNGRYELLRHIARGGMADVYLARVAERMTRVASTWAAPLVSGKIFKTTHAGIGPADERVVISATSSATCKK